MGGEELPDIELDAPTQLRPLTKAEQEWVERHLALAPPTTTRQKEDIARLLYSKNPRSLAARCKRATDVADRAGNEPYAPDHATRDGATSYDDDQT